MNNYYFEANTEYIENNISRYLIIENKILRMTDYIFFKSSIGNSLFYAGSFGIENHIKILYPIYTYRKEIFEIITTEKIKNNKKYNNLYVK